MRTLPVSNRAKFDIILNRVKRAISKDQSIVTDNIAMTRVAFDAMDENNFVASFELTNQAIQAAQADWS